MNLIVQLIVYVVTTLISMALRPKPPAPKSAALGDFDVPIAEEGTPINVFFGENWQDGPNVLYYGDLKTTPIKKSGGKK